jgi:integrase
VRRPQVRVRFRRDRELWEVDYRDTSGVRRRLLFATEEEAHQNAGRAARAVGQFLPLNATQRDLTLREYAEQWLATIEGEKEPATVRSYAERLHGHVLPAPGHLRLRDLHRVHIKAFIGEKRRQGHAKNSVRLMKAALSTLLSDAADDGLIDANPAFQLGRRKAARADRLTPAERLQKIRPMSWEQRDRFLGAVAGDRRYAALFAVLAKAGLRPSEAFALQLGDVDARGRTLRVERAWALGRLKATKTYEERTVDLTADLVRVLERHLAWVKAETLRHGWRDMEWLFPNDDGHPLDESRARKAFKQALKRAGLPAFRLYDLRHTYASLLLAASAPITYVSAQLGHANPSTTLRYYARWIPSQGRRWVDVLDRMASTVAAGMARLVPDLEPIWNQNDESGTPRVVGVPDSTGGPSRTRTLDPLIKSQLLYQLS